MPKHQPDHQSLFKWRKTSMKAKKLLYTILIILWGLILTWGVVFANNTIYSAVSNQLHSSYVNDILSDAVFLFVAFMPAVWIPRFFGYQLGSISRNWKLL